MLWKWVSLSVGALLGKLDGGLFYWGLTETDGGLWKWNICLIMGALQG